VFGLIGQQASGQGRLVEPVAQGFGNQRPLIFSYYLMSFIFSSLGVEGTVDSFPGGLGPRWLIGLAIGPGDVCAGPVLRRGQRADWLKPVGFFDVLAVP